MDRIVIEGVTGYNGEYPLEADYFTNRELHLIKVESGVRAGELAEAFDAGDNDLMVALAAIAIWRKRGQKPNMDALWDAPAGKFTFLFDGEDAAEDDDDSLPPSIALEETDTGNGSRTDGGETSSDSPDSPPVSDLRVIGQQG